VVVLSQTSVWVWALAVFAALFVAALVWVVVVVLLQRAAGRRIGSVVSGAPASAQTGPWRAGSASAVSRGVELAPPPELAIETLAIDALPATGAVYEARRVADLNRGPAIRSVYRRAVLLLAIPIALVLVARGALARDVREIPLWVPILLVVTLALVYFAATASTPRRSIGPIVMPLLGALWVALAIGAVWTIVAGREGRC
jgi:hypothetical protein